VEQQIDYSVFWLWNTGSTTETSVSDDYNDVTNLVCDPYWPGSSSISSSASYSSGSNNGADLTRVVGIAFDGVAMYTGNS
jgi:hypothetical protein